jgi:hypothetical protein
MKAASGTSRSSGLTSPRPGTSSPEAPRPQKAVGEDVAALAVGGELDLVHGQELDPAVERHRLHRAHEVAARGNDPLLARDEGDRLRARSCTSRS